MWTGHVTGPAPETIFCFGRFQPELRFPPLADPIGVWVWANLPVSSGAQGLAPGGFRSMLVG